MINLVLTKIISQFENYLFGGDYFSRQKSMPFVGLKNYEVAFQI